VLASGVATPWEKGVVALALLRSAGVTGELGFFTPGETFAGEVPAAAAFGPVRVVAGVAGDNWWIAPRRERPFPGRCDLPGRTGLFMEAAGAGHRLYTVSRTPTESLLVVRWRPGGRDDGEPAWHADIEYGASGVLWPAGRTARELAEALAASALPEGEVRTVLEEEITETRGRIRLTADAAAFAPDADGLWVLTGPTAPREIAAALPDGLHLERARRVTPLRVEQPVTWETRLRIVLPDTLAVDHAPPGVDRVAAGARFTRTSVLGDGVIEIRSVLTLASGWVAPAQYAAWRTVMAEMLVPASSQLVLVRR
jgi:hypothetical protein